MAERKRAVSTGAPRKIGGQTVTTCEILGPTIVDLIRAGMRPGMAAQAAGISKSAISGWVKRGSEEQWRIEQGEAPTKLEAPYLEFVQSMMKAEAEAQAGLVVSWFREARQGDWKAAQAFLAKRWPDEWGDSNTLKVELTGVGGGAIQTEMRHSLVEDEDRKRAVLSALVEAGDLPNNVLNAWDGTTIDAEVIDDITGTTIDTDGLEEAVRTETAAHASPETDSIPDMGNN
jgi:hypothetical protein